jgi:hypothetical protein
MDFLSLTAFGAYERNPGFAGFFIVAGRHAQLVTVAIETVDDEFSEGAVRWSSWLLVVFTAHKGSGGGHAPILCGRQDNYGGGEG